MMPLDINAIGSIFRAFGAYSQLLVVGIVLSLFVYLASAWRSHGTSTSKASSYKQMATICEKRVHDQAPLQISGTRSKRILLIANDVTLAHFARPYTIAKYLTEHGHEVVLAASPKSLRFISSFAGKIHALRPTDTAAFLDNLKYGRPLFDIEALKRDAEEDEALIKMYQPDLIIGDFRITLSVTARIHSVPYVAISNAYWDSRYQPQFTIPELPIVGFLGVTISQFFFNIVRPIAFALHCIPMNALRKFYGLTKRSYDVRDVYSDADLLLFSDVHELYKKIDGSSGSIVWDKREETAEFIPSTPKVLFVGRKILL